MNHEKWDGKKRVYKYSEILEIMNEFMEATGIRQYCSQVCKGSCCAPLGCNEWRRKKPKCKQKLACASWVCPPLLKAVAYFIPIRFIDVLMNETRLKTSKALGKSSDSAYLCSYDATDMKDVVVRVRLPKRCNQEKIKQLRNLFDYCISKGIDRYDLYEEAFSRINK